MSIPAGLMRPSPPSTLLNPTQSPGIGDINGDTAHDHISFGSLELLQIRTMAFCEAVDDVLVRLAEDARTSVRLKSNLWRPEPPNPLRSCWLTSQTASTGARAGPQRPMVRASTTVY